MTSRVPLARYALLAVLFALAATFHTRLALDLLRGGPAARAPFAVDVAGHIKKLEPEAEAAGLQLQDRVLRVADEPFVGESTLARALAALPPSAALPVRVLRLSGSQTFQVQPQAPASSVGRGHAVVLGVLMPLVCLTVGFWATLVRPRDPLAWLLLGLMLSLCHFTTMLAPEAPLAWPDGLRQFGLAYATAIFTGWPIFMLLFAIEFPERVEWDRRHAWLKWLLLAPLALGGLRTLAARWAEAENLAFAARHPALGRFLGLQTALMMAAIGVFFATLGAKGGFTRDPDARRRLRILNLGAQLGFTPMFLLVLGALVRTRQVRFDIYPEWLLALAALFTVLFPAALGYVVIVDRALDVRVIVRQGIQYALARRGVVVLQVLLTAVGAGAALMLVAAPDANRPQKIRAIFLALWLGVLLHKFRLKVAAWIDRRFFRDSYDAEQILTDLAESVRTMVETEPLLRTVAERISNALHVPRIALLLREGAAFRPAFALGYEGAPAAAFAESSAAATQLREEGAPLFPARAALPAQDAESAGALAAQVLLPLAVKDRLVGIMSLGPKKSEEPYSGGDLRLLRSVAAQAGLALENSRLTEAVAREVAQRARLSRDIEIAREVQERLFPQELPPLPGYDYAGHCRPALGVGGDYYDFLPAGHEFGLAIGDVSGKGIPAALLMASLQASLRAQTLDGAADLAALMARINRLVHQASGGAKYATFFYAQLDPAARVLDYVNAGHNAPMLFRGGELLRLTEGGAVVGLMPDFPYTQARVALQPGDLLVGYTDGVSEAMNPADEEWGEERMAAAVRAARDLPANELIQHLMEEADAFAAGARQHDDMTLIVLRVGGSDGSQSS